MSLKDASSMGAPGAEPVEQPPAPDVDITKPHIARIYDYFLGGKHNYAVDRQAAEQVLKAMPDARLAARVNRRFLIESVRWMMREAGIRQFLDIGSGLPTQQNVHEVAQAIDKDARVVYIDNDPLVRVHAEALLATDPNTIFLTGDLRDGKALLDRPEVREHLDFTEPIGLLLVAVLHFIRDNEEAYAITDALYEALPPGSYVAISHAMRPDADSYPEGYAAYNRATASLTLRTPEEIGRFFEGCTPIGSGLSRLADWHLGDSHGDPRDDNVIAIGDTSALKDFPGMCGLARIDR